MEAYILDDSLRRIEVVEQYHSFIWTERWSSSGDFVLEVPPTSAEARMLTKGKLLACDKSDRVMQIQTAEIATSEDGARFLKVTGPSLEDVMKERPNKYTEIIAGTPQAANGLTIGNGTTDKPADLVRTLFNGICVTAPGGTPFTNDVIPFMEATAYYSQTGALGYPIETPIIQTPIGTLYDTIKAICDTYRMGFRIVRIESNTPWDDAAQLYFEVFMGFDRTSGQTTYDAVIFSEELDNLMNTSELESISGMKNVAYVYAAAASAVVYAPGVDSTISGFNKRVLVVDASDITDAVGATLTSKMNQRGLSELAKARRIVGFDGQIPKDNNLRYGTDYLLGDLVEQRNSVGSKKVMRVAEQIFTSDANGDKSYPTLIIDSVVEPGTWDAVLGSQHWNDAIGVWDAN